MQPVADFFAMGGYGAFVWPAFGLTALVLTGLAVASRRSLRSREHLLSALENANTAAAAAEHRR
jgi:heme exporter protein D